MTPGDLRSVYLTWTRRALPALLLPLALTGAVQAAASRPWWNDSPPPAGGMRYLFVAVAVASVVMGRSTRARDIAAGSLDAPRLVSLSWRMVIHALAPAFIGAVLALMTRDVMDFYLQLLVTLVGVALLYPRFDQWVLWSGHAGGKAD